MSGSAETSGNGRLNLKDFGLKRVSRQDIIIDEVECFAGIAYLMK